MGIKMTKRKYKKAQKPLSFFDDEKELQEIDEIYRRQY